MVFDFGVHLLLLYLPGIYAENIIFDHCSLSGAVFDNASMSEAKFIGCLMRDSRFGNTNLTRAHNLKEIICIMQISQVHI
jgi:uncharacterized protein YjbI with pentapeptide repeats